MSWGKPRPQILASNFPICGTLIGLKVERSMALNGPDSIHNKYMWGKSFMIFCLHQKLCCFVFAMNTLLCSKGSKQFFFQSTLRLYVHLALDREGSCGFLQVAKPIQQMAIGDYIYICKMMKLLFHGPK